MENKKLIVGNMKMNLTLKEVKSYIKEMEDYKDCAIVCPSSLYLSYFIENGFTIGIQNISEYNIGAYTGDIAPVQAVSMGIDYTIIGHSERREYYGEDDAMINRKIINALNNKLKVILCIGETLEEKENNMTEDKIKKQLLNDLQNIDSKLYENVIIAYEPIWAIGTGKVPNSEDIYTITKLIKETIKEKFSYEPKVLYGGSTNDNNIEELNKITNVDGFLIGGACLVPAKFIKIIETIKNNK